MPYHWQWKANFHWPLKLLPSQLLSYCGQSCLKCFVTALTYSSSLLQHLRNFNSPEAMGLQYVDNILCAETEQECFQASEDFLNFLAGCGSVQLSSVAQSCPTLCDPMNRSTPGLPVHHQHPEFTQTHVHRVSDAIQPSHPLSSPFPPAPNPSQHQGLFQ